MKIPFDSPREDMNPEFLKKLLGDREKGFDFNSLDYTYSRSLYYPIEVLYIGMREGDPN